MTGEGGGSEGVDEAYAHRSMDGFGRSSSAAIWRLAGPIQQPKVRADHRGAFAHCRHGCGNDRAHADNLPLGAASVAGVRPNAPSSEAPLMVERAL